MRLIWFVVGVVALGLGMLGVILPLLPTTPFILLAAFAFARSSQRWHDWLVAHPVFGPMIANWRDYGAISRRAKIIGTLSMAGVFVLSFVLNAPATVLVVQAVVLIASAAFVLTRPAPPPADLSRG
ncbi:MAG: YbaN family protein [Pseudomonadota bacterium]